MSESERTLSLYEILGIPSSSPISAIRHAYYQLCLTLHPDRCSPSTFNPTQFQRVQHAWEILRDPTTRQQYDTTLGIHNSSSYSFEHLTIDDLCESASSASGDTYFARCRCGGNVSIRITDVDQLGVTMDSKAAAHLLGQIANNAASVGKTAEFVDLVDQIRLDQCEALNKSPKCAAKAVFKKHDDELSLYSDEDDCEMLLKITFGQAVKLSAIAIHANKAPVEHAAGPKKVKVFVNQPNIGFDDAESKPGTQELDLTLGELSGTQIPLRFVKFQNVSSLQFFFVDNQSNADVTFINRISLFGIPIAGMDVSEIKKPEEHD